jgi:hypothetical protein
MAPQMMRRDQKIKMVGTADPVMLIPKTRRV